VFILESIFAHRLVFADTRIMHTLLILVSVDPNQPCAPDKNGLYFPHPVLCNKFMWCVQGREVVQHCPLGTLYLGGGQCTFEPALSECYIDTVP